jgi:hypothetical protein
MSSPLNLDVWSRDGSQKLFGRFHESYLEEASAQSYSSPRPVAEIEIATVNDNAAEA